MKRVYVAGSYNGPNVIRVLDNMRIGMEAAKKVLLHGMAPFCPWFDYHFQLMLKGHEDLTIEDYYNYSIAWLEKSDAVYVCNLRKESVGTKKEIDVALRHGIPVFYLFQDLLDWQTGINTKDIFKPIEKPKTECPDCGAIF